MKVLVFAKKRTTKEGKPFTAYVSKLTKKNGEEMTVGVKFREECGAPKDSECPCYIDVDKKNANISKRTMEVEDNATHEIRVVESNTLWISDWKKNPEKYVDHSLDDFE